MAAHSQPGWVTGKTVAMAGAAALGVAALARFRFLDQIYISDEVVAAYREFHGYVQHYSVRVGCPLLAHEFVVARGVAEQTGATDLLAFEVHLVLRGLGWTMVILPAHKGWRPPPDLEPPKRKHTLCSALLAGAEYCLKFNVYRLFAQNCRHFARWLAKSIRKRSAEDLDVPLHQQLPFDAERTRQLLTQRYKIMLVSAETTVLRALIKENWRAQLVAAFHPCPARRRPQPDSKRQQGVVAPLSAGASPALIPDATEGKETKHDRIDAAVLDDHVTHGCRSQNGTCAGHKRRRRRAVAMAALLAATAGSAVALAAWISRPAPCARPGPQQAHA